MFTMKSIGIFLVGLAVVSALPADPVVRKLVGDDEPRYQYVEGPDGTPHLVDHWVKASDIAESARYDADESNVYHVFTVNNTATSAPLVMNNNALLANNPYDAKKRTILLLHGWLEGTNSLIVSTIVPAILANNDVNVIVVDWSTGANTINYPAAVLNMGVSGRATGRFINWLTQQTGGKPEDWHIIGQGLGGHKCGVVGRYVTGSVSYISSLDPLSQGFALNDDKLKSTDAAYVEVIHTNAGLTGYFATLGDVDFYPNGGIGMPGCLTETCDHARAVHYMAESIRTGGFTGTRCSSYVAAMAGTCFLWGNLNMGGLTPKTGQSGVFRMETNASPPFSRG